MTQTFRLHWTDAIGTARTFTTPQVEWHGETWNGFPAIQLPKWVAYLLDMLIEADPDQTAPSLSTNDEADDVWADGLQWELAECRDCGVIHSSEHSCEPIGWTYAS